MTRLLGGLAILLGLGALAGSYFVWNDYNSEFRRMSSELAEMNVSLQLLTQRAPAKVSEPVATPKTPDDSAAQITELKTRVASLEQAARLAELAPPVAHQAVAAMPGPSGTANSGVGPATDCIPIGKRFLLTPNDTYAVCQTTETLRLTAVSAGEVVFDKIGSVAAGGIAKLGATNCRVAIMSVMEEGQFAEVRVSC